MKGASVICSWVLMVPERAKCRWATGSQGEAPGSESSLGLEGRREPKFPLEQHLSKLGSGALQWPLRTCWKCKLLDRSTEHRQWRAGKPGRLQPTGLQRVRPDLVTERPPATQSYLSETLGAGAQPPVSQWNFQVVLVSAGELLLL